MRQYLTATIQAASQSEIEGMVDPIRLAAIKRTDPDPAIRVYSLGHEGKADLNLAGIGRKTLTWIQAAVQWVGDKLLPGTAVFNNHDPNTNSHIGRTQIGEVVGKAVKHIGDHLNALAAIYILPEFKTRPLDFASIEADIEYAQDGFQAWPTAINNISGIALGNSGIDSPGIPGATLLGAVQAYVQAFGGEIGEKQMNLSDVKQAVKDLGLKPSQVFGVDDIMGDSAVDVKVKEVTKEHFAMAKRVGDERDVLRDKVAKLENEKADSDKHLQQFQMQSKSATVIEPILTERKLDDKAKAFVKRNLKNFTTTAVDEDALKIDLGKFVDETNMEYKEMATLFGANGDNTQPNTDAQFKIPPELFVDNKQQTQTQQPAVPTTRAEVLQAEMNPDVNPLIPGGKAAQEALKT